MQGTNQLIRSNWGLGVLLRDTSTRPGWDRTGNPPTARRQLYLLSHIAPVCNSLLASLPTYAIQPLHLIQNAAARLVFSLPKFSHVTPLLRSLHWLPVAARIRFKVMTLAYTAANKPATPYLQDIIQAYTPAPPLRSAATGRLAHPASSATGSRSSRLWSFSTLAPQWRNDLPIPVGFCILI